jgi:iron complex transport system ATP-binding protein
MTTLSTNALTLAYDDSLIVDAMTLTIPDQRVTALVGPNGCGKSTLLRGMARLLAPRAGVVLLDGREIHQTPSKELARKLGILPQGPVAPEGLTVRELVAQGRYPHQSWYQQWSEADERATQTALDKTGLTALSDRPIDALSGGQRQRAWIAMTLAQETTILLLDEPTTYLDMSHQLEVMHLLRDLNADGATIVLVVHDLNLAARYAHHMIALSSGKIAAAGPPAEVMTAEMLREVFNVEADIVRDPRLGVPLCLPHNLRA